MRERIVTGVVLVVVFLGLLTLAPNGLFFAALAALSLPAATEWRRISRCSIAPLTLSAVIAVLALVGVLAPLVAALLCVVSAGFYSLLFYRARRGELFDALDASPQFLLDVGLVTTVSATVAVLVGLPGSLEISRAPLILWMMGTVWVADSGAYFVGRKFGVTKLAPSISPGKTREGLYGALAAGLVWAVLWSFWLGDNGVPFWQAIVVTLVGVAYSVFGDLVESAFKRRAGVKDSGNLLPGHGGILDRLDGVFGAIPIMALLLLLL